MVKKGSLIVAASIVAVLVIFFVFSRFFVDLLWFSSLGFRNVFTTTWLTVLAVFVVATGLSTAILLLNGFIATGMTSAGPSRPHNFRIVGRSAQGLPEVIELSLDNLPLRLIITTAALIVGVFIGFAQTSNWDVILKWYYAAPFGRSDPLFGNDLGFYVFSLPVYELLKDWGLLIIFLSGASAVAIYLLRGGIDYQQTGFPALSAAAIRHLSALLAIVFSRQSGQLSSPALRSPDQQ